MSRKILISSHAFWPQIGGIETASDALGSAFVERGHEVKLVTSTPPSANEDRSFLFEVIRQPTRARLWELVKWCDVFFHNNISLRTCWPVFPLRKPWVVTSQTWIKQPDGSRGWGEFAKLLLLRFATRVAISEAVAHESGLASTVIPNPYRDDVFRHYDVQRAKEVIFVGRLVSDKGVDLLIEALGILKEQSFRPTLTIVGSGPEEAALRALAAQREVAWQVSFVGSVTGGDLAKLLNEHQVLAVPSRWAEPFGIVAVEGIACGCVVVGSEAGGLKEAIGSAGVVFPNGDAAALASGLRKVLQDSSLQQSCRSAAGDHLHLFRRQAVGDRYLNLFEQALR